MKIKTFTIFTGSLNDGNPAQGNSAKVLLVHQLPEMQTHLDFIQLHSDYADDTFVYIKALAKHVFGIRWFNGQKSIQRCGHGTLAAAAYIHREAEINIKQKAVYDFVSETETLSVTVNEGCYSITMPVVELYNVPLQTIENSEETEYKNNEERKKTAFNYGTINRASQTETDDGYIIVELKDAHAVKCFVLEAHIIKLIRKRALIITAKNTIQNSDIVFRYFAPQYGNIEDMATGSAGSILWPFWKHALGLNKKRLRCSQLSKQGGDMYLSQENIEEVIVSGEVTASQDNEC